MTGRMPAKDSIEKAREFMEQHGVEEAGGMAQSVNHGLVVKGDGRTIFFETKSPESAHGPREKG